MKKELYKALVDLYNDYKALADAGNWHLEDTKVGITALKAIEKYEKYGWKDHDGSEICPVDGNKRVKAYRDWETDRKSTRLNSSHRSLSRMPSSA